MIYETIGEEWKILAYLYREVIVSMANVSLRHVYKIYDGGVTAVTDFLT